MSDEEYERFEITDYDLDNEFNPNRPRRKISKHQAIYGIWANDSDDENRGRTRKGRSGFASKNNRYKDYSAPVSFVAGGVHKPSKEEESEASNDDNNEITDEEDEDKTTVRRGFGKGKVVKNDASTEKQKDSSDTDSENESTEENPPSSKSSFNFKANNTSSMFSQRHQQSGGNNLNMGAWEQHTRGIGAKLLLQMGYKPGKGLGKDLQGRAQPVEAHVRKGRGAIGAYGPEGKTTPSATSVKAAADETTETKDKSKKWRKISCSNNYTSNDKVSNKKYYYKSVEEVIEKSKKASFTYIDKKSKHLSNVPVIDMTGPEKRVLSGYHALSQSRLQEEDDYYGDPSDSVLNKSTTGAGGVGFELPELMHNLTLIVDMCEQDIITLDTTEHAAKDRQIALTQEKHKLEQIVKLEQNHMNTLEEILDLIDELVAENSNLTLQRAEDIFHILQTNYIAEYKEFCLGDLAASVIAPLLKKHLENNWQPLQNPTQNVDLVKRWRAILQRLDKESDIAPRSNVFDPYSALIWAGVMPSLRSTVSNWKPKQHQPMAALLDCWAPLLPSWILDSVLEQLILPRLTDAVCNWDPLTDVVPIHAWILPWNIILGNKMEQSIYPMIRDKLGNALQNWLPQDRSARAMLTPWKGAFDVKAMEVFLGQHIVPKLQLVLDELIINPLHQDLELWNQFWEWNTLLTISQIGRLLDKHFFPKWMQVLVLWLNQSPDFVEIFHWYTGWKNMLSENVQNETYVKEHLRRALEIIHRATDTVIPSPNIPIIGGIGIGHQATSIPTMPNITIQPPPPVTVPPPSLMDLQIPLPAQLEFKDLVSRKCAEKGILFAPMPGRREHGKQIYRVGKLYCYIDRNVCMIGDGNFNKWAPISLQSMIEQAV